MRRKATGGRIRIMLMQLCGSDWRLLLHSCDTSTSVQVETINKTTLKKRNKSWIFIQPFEAELPRVERDPALDLTLVPTLVSTRTSLLTFFPRLQHQNEKNAGSFSVSRT